VEEARVRMRGRIVIRAGVCCWKAVDLVRVLVW